MNIHYDNRVVVDPRIMVGKPIIKGTRITVELILRQLAQGITIDDVLINYPHLTREDVYAAIAYASEVVEEEKAYPVAAHFYGQAKAFTG